MTILRVFWALFLAGLVAYAFQRAWNWEHGAPLPKMPSGSDKARSKETAVWIDPSFLPVLLLIFLILFGIMSGWEGIKQFLSMSLDVMLVISIYFLVLIFLMPLVRKYFSARACATMWILPVFMFWQSHILFNNAPVPLFVIYIPSNILKVLFLVWAVGFCVVFIGKVISHFVFRHRVMSASIPVRNPTVRALFEQELKELEYYYPVRLMTSSAVSVPLSMGKTKQTRVTVLPNREFAQQELQFIFRHEIHHLQRNDVGNKVFFAFCQALCWFNPLMWVAVRKASDDLELSCDEIVLENMDEGVRRQYAELLLDTAGYSGGFTTCLSATAETMRYRLQNVMTVRKRRAGTLMLAVAMFLCVMAYGAIAVSNEKGTVAELIMEHRTAADIRSVKYRLDSGAGFGKISEMDGERLFSYLSSLGAEKISSVNRFRNDAGPGLAMTVGNDSAMELIFYNKFVEVHHYGRKSYPEYYVLNSKLDWDVIKGCWT